MVNPRGKRLVAYGGNHILTWTAASPADPIESFELPAGTQATQCTISPDDGAVAVACEKDGIHSVYFWRADGSSQFSSVEFPADDPGKPIGSLSLAIGSLSLASQEGPLAILFENMSVRLWGHVVNERGAREWQRLDEGTLRGAVYLRHGGRRMALRTETGIQLWQLEDDWLATTHDAEIPGRSIVVSDSPHRFAAVIDDANELALWDIWRNKKQWAHSIHGKDPTPQFSPDGHRMALCTETDILLWKLDDDSPAATPDTEIRGTKIVLSEVVPSKIVPSNHPQRYAAVVTGAGEVALWEIWRTKRLWIHKIEGRIVDLTFISDGTCLVVTTDGEHRELVCKQYIVESGTETIVGGKESNDKPCSRLELKASSSDGRRAVTFENGDKRVRVWDMERSDELAVFEQSADSKDHLKFKDAFFSADNRYLITISNEPKDNDQTLSIWEIGFDCVEEFVAENHQIASQHHVIGTRYVDLIIDAEVVVTPGSPKAKLQQEILKRLTEFFDPRCGGPEESGWPFDRDVTRSEVYSVIHSVPGVSYVPSLHLNGADLELEVQQFQLVNFLPDASTITIS